MRQTIFEACRCVSARDAAEALGLRFDRNRRAWCPLCGSSRANMAFSNGLFHCYACHAGGDAVRLVELVMGLAPLDAARWVNREFNCGYDDDSHTLTDAARDRVLARQAQRRQEEQQAARRRQYINLIIWSERYIDEHHPACWDGMTETYKALLGMRHLFDTIWTAGTDAQYVPAGWLDEEVNKIAAIRGGSERPHTGRVQVASDKSGHSRPVRHRIPDGRTRHSGILHTVQPRRP